MFTGLVEEMGRVVAVTDAPDARRITIAASRVIADAALGDSISVNGVCLTVTERDAECFSADIMKESLDRSTLGTLGVGSRVNLERALAVGDRLGGHIMQGHVDATTRLLSRTTSTHWDVLRFALPPALARYVVEKGSIALDGTSLTVSAVGVQDSAEFFEVSLIPATLTHTALGERAVGESVNIEVDILGKYVERMLHHAEQAYPSA